MVDSKYTEDEDTGCHISQSKTGQIKYWYESRVNPDNWSKSILQNSALADVYAQSIAVMVLGKDKAPKTKFSQTEQSFYSRLPYGTEAIDFTDYKHFFDNDRRRPDFEMDILISSMVFKEVMGDDDINAGGYIVAGGVVYPIDAEQSFSKTLSYEDFKEKIETPQVLLDEILETEFDKDKRISDKFLKDTSPDKVFESFKFIVGKISEDNFSILDRSIGTFEGEKGILPDLYKASENGVYTSSQIDIARSVLEDTFKPFMKEQISLLQGYIKKYEKEKVLETGLDVLEDYDEMGDDKTWVQREAERGEKDAGVDTHYNVKS